MHLIYLSISTERGANFNGSYCIYNLLKLYIDKRKYVKLRYIAKCEELCKFTRKEV